MKLALDTSAYIALARGKAPKGLPEAIAQAEEVILPYVVIGELRAGFLLEPRGADDESLLQSFIESKAVRVVYPDDATTRHYAQVFAFLKQKGKPIPLNDMWLAAMVQRAGAVLVTLDKHFEHLPQLHLWRAPR